eukprot:804255_1
MFDAHTDQTVQLAHSTGINIYSLWFVMSVESFFKIRNMKQSSLQSLLYCLFELSFGTIGIVVIGIFYGICWNHSPSASFNTPITEIPIPKIFDIYTTPLRTVDWSDIDGDSHLNKMLSIGRSRTPTRIKNAPSTQWKANAMWRLSQSPRNTIQYMAQLHYNHTLKSITHQVPTKHYELQHDKVTVHRINHSNFFTFEDLNRPYLRHNMSNTSDTDHMMINTSFIGFLRYINNRKYSALNVNNSYLYYFNSAINFADDLKPLHWFKMKDKTVQFTDKHIRELLDINHIHMEISPSALFINSFYDITHNFYYQIDGTRRVLISPPSETLKLRPFPEGHSSYRSSQIPHKFYFIPLRKWTSHKSYPFEPTQDKIKAWNVTLQPGDLLYVPPFYWTQMTTLTNSIGVKSSSLGFEQVFVALSDASMLPRILREPSVDDVAEQKYLLHQLAFFTRQVIDRILKALPDVRDNVDGETVNEDLQWNVVHKWIKEQLIDGRYRGNVLWNEMKCSEFDVTRCPIYGNTTQGLMKEMEQTANTWALAYKQIRKYVEEDVYYIRNMMLATHAEQFLSYIAGHLNYCYFLQCLVNQRFGNLYIETAQKQTKERMRQQQI